jgi:two-component system osmolarity sensor histidine kinase EnvZ
MVRIIEAAPPPIRQSLARAAGNRSKRVIWIPATSAAAGFLDASKVQEEGVARIVAADTHRTTLVLPETRPKSLPAELDFGRKGSFEYMLAVRLLDRGWVVFATANRSWGLSQMARWSIWTIFLAASISLFTMVAARQFAGPIKELAAAVRGFGVNPQAPPIAESGPRELRQVIPYKF